jgi:cytoskeleton protein RodZ
VASTNVETSAVAVTIENLGQGRGSLITVTAIGDDKLEFSFSDECWVEVTDAGGASIYGDLNRTGDSLVIYGTAPFEVLFGKAPAAKLAFNGKPFALARYTSADLTAKVKLGR